MSNIRVHMAGPAVACCQFRLKPLLQFNFDLQSSQLVDSTAAAGRSAVFSRQCKGDAASTLPSGCDA
jgi:hypothetical protein